MYNVLNLFVFIYKSLVISSVIMKNTYHNNLTQVPEPGFFSGNTAETELYFNEELHTLLGVSEKR